MLETIELGRLKYTSEKDRCPECQKPMQVRARKGIQLVLGVENTVETDYLHCSFCGLDLDMEQKHRKIRVDRTYRKDDVGGKDGYKERTRLESIPREGDRGSARRGIRRTS